MIITEEQKILYLLWNRVDTAVDALAKQFGKRLYRTALNILGNTQDAEEVVNDTYLAIWNAIPPERPNPLAAYIYRTGKNIALNHLRLRSAQKRDSQYNLSLDELAEVLQGDSLDDTLDARLLGQAINRFLATQTQQNRILFLQRYWFGDSIPQIAKSNHLSENALSVRLHRIRTQLKTFLYMEGFLDEP